MERILLVVLVLTGRLARSGAVLRRYHLVNRSLTWPEAQTHCRRVYGDLATTGNSEELDQLLETASDAGSPEVWIGLYSEIRWMWSDGFTGSGAGYRNWYSGQPNPSRDQFCVCVGDNGQWWDDGCGIKYTFVCYRGTPLDPEFVAVEERMSWSGAQKYCRENFVDLATIRTDADNLKVQNLVPSDDWTWIGLFRDHLHWSDGTKFLLEDWDGARPADQTCGSASVTTTEKLGFQACDGKLPFVCQSLPSPVRRQVVRLRLKLQDSVDLNQPAVKADLLEKLQNKLDRVRVRVGLKWRQQLDGKIFHREAEKKD